MLKEIKSYLKFTKDKEFANYLGIKPTVLSNWHSRNTFDNELIYTKCDFINPNWLLTGKGDMVLKDQENLTGVSEPPTTYQQQATTVEWLEKELALTKKLLTVQEQYNADLRELLNLQNSSKQQAG